MNPWRAGCQLGGSSWQDSSEKAGGLDLSGRGSVSRRKVFQTGGSLGGKGW